MTLTLQQISKIADAISDQLDFPTLETSIASHLLNFPVANIAGQGTLKQQAYNFIKYLNEYRPPRDREFLQVLAQHPNAVLQRLANDLLTPGFFPPAKPACDAILLGRLAFVDRQDLRSVVRDFINPSLYTTHVLIVRGEQPGGKSYSWHYLQHLAFHLGATAMRLRLRDASYTPRHLFENVGRLLRLDLSGLPPMTDEPQLSRTDPLVSWFKGQIVSMERPYWLVIDDLNEPSATKPMREAAYAIACAVEEIKPENLWVALLGYNDPIANPDLQFVALDDARFPDAAHVAEHFQCIANESPQTLTPARAREIADLVFAKVAHLDRENMPKITSLIQQIGEKLRLGQQP